VGALGHYLEKEGLATTQISLIREHTVAIRPPRALWVPFELGRPLGVAGDADFQTRVLLAALELLEAKDGPVLQDFAEDLPAPAGGDSPWICPLNLDRKTEQMQNKDALERVFREEVLEIRPSYDLAVKNRSRTTVEASSLDLATMVDLLCAFTQSVPANPRPDLALGYTLNLVVHDLKAYYYEAACAQPSGRFPSGMEIDNWFWEQTAAAQVLFAVRRTCLASGDRLLRLVGRLLLVPLSQAHRIAGKG